MSKSPSPDVPAFVKPGLIGTAAVVVVVFIIFPIWFSGLGVLAVAESVFRAGAHIWIPVLAALFVLIAGTAAFKSVRAGAVLAIVIALGGIGNLIVFHSYATHRLYADVQTVETPTDFAERAPWNVAENYAARDQGDVIGDRGSVHYVPNAVDADAVDGEGTSRYTTLVEGRSFLGFHGYQAIQTLEMPTTGPIPGSASSYCEVPEDMNDRLGAFWPGHSMSWSIHAKKPLAHWDNDDAYGYCDGDKPTVVVPLWKYEGFWLAKRVPDGAAVYTTEGIQIMTADELVKKGIEGPTYPRSVAKVQRKALNAGGSLGDWWGSRHGYDGTEKDEEDSNEGNTSEFTLTNTAGELSYVTPLTPRGSSQSITAVSIAPAQQGHGGTVVVNTSTDLGSTSTVTTAIKESSVSGDNAWTTRWSAGMYVYEILPGADGHWVASIGQGQAVSYRADIAPDGSVTVTNSETGQSSGKADEPGKADDSSVTVEGDKPLSEMTEAELLDRIEKATTELQEREAAEE